MKPAAFLRGILVRIPTGISEEFSYSLSNRLTKFWSDNLKHTIKDKLQQHEIEGADSNLSIIGVILRLDFF